MEQTILRVTGMHCGACESRIQKALSRLEGIRRSSADHQKEEVRVAFEPGRISLDAIRATIEQADYRVEGVVTPSGTMWVPDPLGAPGTADGPGAPV